MIQVLHLIDTYRIGGPGKTIINSAKYIDHRRYRIHVGAFTTADESRNEFARAVQEADIPFLDLRETKRFNPSHITQMRAYIRDHRISIVHAHGYRTDLLAYLATRGLRRLVLVTTHHGWIRNTPKERAAARFALWLCGRFDGVEAVSHLLLDETPAAHRRDGRAVVVHNAIVPDDYRAQGVRDAIRQELGVRPEDPLVGVIGRLSPEKGCLDMLEGMRELTRTLPRARLLLVGEGPLEEEVRRRLAGLGLDGRVHLVPHQRRIQPYYEAMDVLASPSHTEGISNVILEAMVSGRPVVATRVGGTPEIVVDGESGVLVAPRRPDELAAALHRVLTDRALYSRLAANAVARIGTEFSFEARMRREEGWYARALSGAGLQ